MTRNGRYKGELRGNRYHGQEDMKAERKQDRTEERGVRKRSNDKYQASKNRE